MAYNLNGVIDCASNHVHECHPPCYLETVIVAAGDHTYYTQARESMADISNRIYYLILFDLWINLLMLGIDCKSFILKSICIDSTNVSRFW